MKFEKIIQEKRIEKKLSLKDMAEECGISATYLSALEKGNTETYAEGLIYKIAEVLDLDGDELIIAKNKCPRWVQEFVVNNWQETKAFLHPKSRVKVSSER